MVRIHPGVPLFFEEFASSYEVALQQVDTSGGNVPGSRSAPVHQRWSRADRNGPGRTFRALGIGRGRSSSLGVISDAELRSGRRARGINGRNSIPSPGVATARGGEFDHEAAARRTAEDAENGGRRNTAATSVG